jgi:hypothetical protein
MEKSFRFSEQNKNFTHFKIDKETLINLKIFVLTRIITNIIIEISQFYLHLH